MQKVNSPMHRFAPQLFGAVFLILAQIMLVRPVTAQITPDDLRVPAFSATTGTVLTSTSGNWVTVHPQEPGNIGLLETNLYEMPHKGSGLMSIEFKLVGADGGTAHYNWGLEDYFANGGQGAKLNYTINLGDSTAGHPFILTFGKMGQSASSNGYLYCSGGGGGSTGMAWVVPNAKFCQFNFGGPFSLGLVHIAPGSLIAAAGGGGGGFGEYSAVYNGGGASSLQSGTQFSSAWDYDTTELGSDGFNEILASGGSTLSYDTGILNASTCCTNLDAFEKASSWVHNVFKVSTSFITDTFGFGGGGMNGFSGSGTVLNSITYGQGGGQATDIFEYPSQQVYVYNGSFDLNSNNIYVSQPGASGGCGFGGGGAGVSNSTYFTELSTQNLVTGNGFPTGGGGGSGSVYTNTASGVYPDAGPGGMSYVNPNANYINNVSIASANNTSSPQSGYFEYRTQADTIPPVIGSIHDTLYIGNDPISGYPNTSVKLTPADVINKCSDNDSIKSITFSDSILGCSYANGVTWPIVIVVTDFAGNSSVSEAYITVVDTSHPILPLQAPPDPLDPSSYAPFNIDVSAGPYVLSAYNFPTGYGGCDNNLTVHFTPDTFTCAQVGTHPTINYYYTNSNGKSSPVYQKTFNIIVENYPVFYVDPSATGANNGSSWADAFTHLQDAINYGCPGNRDIYVAQGTYYPDQGNYITLGDRSASFTVPEGFSIYGGFPLGGTAFNNRNPAAYPTILSGNIGSLIQTSDNSYHVVTIAGNNTVLDGLTIQDGNANDSAGSGGGGIFFRQTGNVSSAYNTTLNKCTVLNNYGNAGGGAYISYGNVNYENNLSSSNCIFQGNTTPGNGGAIYFYSANNFNTSETFEDCQFNGNTSDSGGAIYASLNNNLTLTNCTFSQNKALAGAGALYINNDASSIIANSIFYFDSTSAAQSEIYDGGFVTVSFSDIQGSGGSGNWNSNIGTDGGNNIDSNPQFVPYGSYVGSFQIYPTSLCHNGGNPNGSYPTFDLGGNTRVVQDTIDIGAYEVNPIVYVAADAPAGGNGTSWATAYNNLQTALNNVGSAGYLKDVWIKRGTYYTDTVGNNRFVSFFIQLSSGIYGGFAGNETAVSQRNIGANPTILSGDIGVLGDNSDNAYHVITLNGNSPRLDGLIIEGGNADYTDPVNESGGAIYDEGYYAVPHPVAANCVFRNNSAKYYAGAVYVSYPFSNYTFDFIQCLFYNNTALRGGAVYVENGQSDTSAGTHVTANFYNCTGVNNSASGFNTGGFCEALVVDGGSSNTATAQYNNCLLLNDGNPINTGLSGGNFIYNNTYTGTNNNDLVNINDPAGPDSLIMTADDGFALQPTSGAVNYGNNSYIYPGDSTDITGGARIKQSIVDAGAYEDWGCLSATVLYVDANVDTATGNGLSWATAYRYLGDALQAANVCPSVDSILIAAGTYYPSGNLNNPASVDTTFAVGHPVKILGGYPSGGGVRNPLQYPVILSGSINTLRDTGNVRHIMVITSGATDTTLIDGITFTGGYAYGGGTYSFYGASFLFRNGGAISTYNSLVRVNNCSFVGNKSYGYGGAIYVFGGTFTSTRSVYNDNTSNSGGALYIDGITDTFALTGNAFLYDTALNGGGGAVAVTDNNNSSADVENNIFIFNGAPIGYGGGLYIPYGTFRVVNNTFYSNSSYQDGGGFYSFNNPNPATLFANNIFWQNTGGNGNNDYSIPYYVTATGNASGINPLFLNTANPLGADGLWFTTDDGLELKPTSPLINSGTDSAVILTTDITGSQRIQLGVVDPGAYEASSEVTRWYVSQGQDSLTQDGASWATAFQQFQQGVNSAKPGDTVWVAVGTYSPDSTGTSFGMKSDVKIYGGFKATEQSLAQRSLSTGYNAILQGNGASVLVNAYVEGSALLDGFVITNGNSAAQGGGMLNDSSSLLIRNVVFTGNAAATDGGGMANLNSSSVLQNVVFNANSAGASGGAIYSDASVVSVVNSTFFSNSANVAGAINSDALSQLTVGNSIFNNSTTAVGFDIYTTQTGNITYCMLQSARTGAGNFVATNPNFNFAQYPAGFDGLWFTGDDGLYLSYFSAGLNSGSNSLATGLTTDITGAARIQNVTVDMGAYESPWLSYCDSTTIKGQHVLYVDGSLAASGDGSSWVNAFSALGDALDRANSCSAIDTILVAQGTYYPTGWQGLTDRTATFNISRSGIHLLGGYPAGGGQRSTGLNNTYLSGDIGVADSAADNSFHVVTFITSGDSSGLDGFIITNGNADSTGSYSYGGGIFINGFGNNSMPVVSNCVLLNNQAQFGGGVFNQGQSSGNASASFINCVFTGDSAYYDGAAMYNNAFSGNASPIVTNCTFYANKASRYAGAIYENGYGGTCSTTLLNCILWANTAGSGASNQTQVYNGGATDSVFYSLVQDSIPASMFDGGHNVFSDPLFAADTTPAGVNGAWFNEYNGLAVKVGSPAVRKGSPAGAPTTDITGFTRLPVPDVGAYQLQDTAATSYTSMTSTGCDSFLSPTARYYWYTSGTYYDTTSNILGNDTLYAVNLTLGKTTYNTIHPSACSSYLSPTGKIYDTTGVYLDTLQTALGCDSFITINLVISSLNDTATVNGATCAALQNNAVYQWIECSSGQVVSGAMQQTFKATHNGNYACVVTLNNCTDTTNCLAVTDLSITDTKAYHFNIYPNPTDGLFTVEQNYNGELTVQIIDGLGRRVKEFALMKPVEQFDITDLAGGLYQAFITNGTEVLGIVKVVKQ